MNTFDVGVLDLAKQRNDEPARVILRRGDKNATTITATITDHGDPADTTGLSARFSMRLPDMAHYYSKAATLDGNAVSITINEEQAASTVGKTSIAFFELLDASGNLIASTSAFDVIVLMGATDGTGIGESYSDELEEAMQQLADARADYEEMREGAGEAIDAANAAASTASAAASTATAAASSATSAAANANQAASDIRAAAERGDFDGFSPVVDIDDGVSSHTITITDREGDHPYTVPTYAAEESARAAAESTRVTAETARATAESARATAEQGRVTAEQSRATAETARASAESVRVTAEQGRASAENARASAESARVTAESARASAETSRANAETVRAAAESTRATEWATVKAEAQDAISAAETATSDANAAASDATAAAAEARAASAATWLSGNVLFGELAEAAVLTTDDAYAAPPMGVEVYGKSTQSGTPTPDAPVEIKSVDDLTLNVCGKNYAGKYVLQVGRDTPIYGTVEKTATGFAYTGGSISNQNGIFIDHKCLAGTTYVLTFTANTSISNVRFYNSKSTTTQLATITNGTAFTPSADGYIRFWVSGATEVTNIQLELGSTANAYEPYVGQSVEIPLGNSVGRSLPDGTRDELTLSYIGPSTEHEGWGVFGATLTQNVDTGTVTSFTQIYTDNDSVQRLFGTPRYRRAGQIYINRVISNRFVYNFAAWNYGNPGQFNCDDVYCFAPHTFADLAEANAWLAENPITLQFPIATPVTHDLGTIELPVNPAPDLTAWADGGSAQPTLAMGYERALSIVIPRIEAAISDLATS